MRFILILLALCAIALCFGIYHSSSRELIAFGIFERHAASTLKEEEISETEHRSSIRFVGDVMLARNVENLMNAYGTSYPYEKLDIHPENAYLVGNFEASVPRTHVHTPSMQFQFSVKKEHVPALSEYGFTHVGLSNNHAYDHGAAGLQNSYAELASAGLVPFGDPAMHGTSSVVFMELQDKTVALVPVYAVVESLSDEVIQEMLTYAEASSDHQVVYVHWGTEYEQRHSLFQERLAYRLIDAGADAIIGHHPHVIQDIELYKGAPIFYSLGNFIFDQYFSIEVQEGLMVELFWDEEDVASYHLIPVSSIGSRSAPYMMGDFERAVLLQKLADNSQTELQEMILNGRIQTP